MSKRLLSVDLVRGLAIVAMIQVHILGLFIARPFYPPGSMLWTLSGIIGGYAAPLFTLISGLSTGLMINSMERKGKTSRRSIFQTMLARGMFLFLLSTAVNVVAGPILHVLDISLLNWGVIQLIGFCICLAPLFHWSPTPLKLLWVVLPLALSEWVYPEYHFVEFLFTGFAPVLPWGSLFFVAMWIGDFILVGRTKPAPARRYMVVGLVGLGLAIPITSGLALLGHPASWEHQERIGLASSTMFVGTFIVLVVLSSFLLDRGSSSTRVRRLATPVAESGKRALTIYYIQLLGIVLSAMLLERYLGHPIKLNWIWFLPLVGVALVSIHVLVNVVWKRYDYFLSLEWVMAKLTKKPQRVVAYTEPEVKST